MGGSAETETGKPCWAAWLWGAEVDWTMAVSEDPLIVSGCIKRGMQEPGETVKEIDFFQGSRYFKRPSEVYHLILDGSGKR